MTKNSTKSNAKAVKKASNSSGGKAKETAETRILRALAHEYAMGQKTPTKDRIASLADMTNNQGSYKTMCGILRRKKLIQYDKDTIWLEEAGLKKVGPELANTPKTNTEFHDKLKEQLKMKKGREIFDFLLDGQVHSFTEIAHAVGVDPGNASLKTYLTTSITKYTDKTKGPNGEKMFALNDSCFPFEPRPTSNDN